MLRCVGIMVPQGSSGLIPEDLVDPAGGCVERVRSCPSNTRVIKLRKYVRSSRERK